MYTTEQEVKDNATNLSYVKQQLIQLYGDQLKTQDPYSVYQDVRTLKARSKFCVPVENASRSILSLIQEIMSDKSN